MAGYLGKQIRVNLTSRQILVETIPNEVFRKYIGGVGIAAKIVYEETTPDTDPLGPENVLATFTGPFTGTRVPAASRHHYCALSPQTGIFGEANVGGSWGAQLKKAGYDGVIITGKAAAPTYLWIQDDQIELRDASPIWGKDAFEAHDWLIIQTNKKATSAVIGQAGENLVAFASIPHVDAKVSRAAGRTGMGAVMGSKNLKAMVVHGTKSIPIYDDAALKASVQENFPHLREATAAFTKYGTSGGVEKYEYMGNFPIKNWQGSRWEEGAKKISGTTMHDTILKGRKACQRCPIACIRHIEVTEGPWAPMDTDGPEYETIGTMGGECLVDDLEAICKANELCNRYGLDTISTGAAIAFGMEAFDKGLITLTDTNGLELVWGNAEAMVEMVKRIALAQDIGILLGKGTAKAAKLLGNNAEEFAVHVKGLEPSAHDPRRFWTQALSYATAARGACHNRSWAHPYELGLSLPELGLEKSMRSYELGGLAEYVAKLQNFQTLNDTFVICRFAQIGGAVSLALTVEWFNQITGQDLTVEELVEVGERIFNLKRLFNTRLGISRKDDFLPPRFMTHNRKGGGLNTQLPPIGQMLADYYDYRGWDETGIPTSALRERLNI